MESLNSSQMLTRVVYVKKVIEFCTSDPLRLLVLSQVCTVWRDTIFNYMQDTWDKNEKDYEKVDKEQERNECMEQGISYESRQRKRYQRDVRHFTAFLFVGQYGLAQRVLYGDVLAPRKRRFMYKKFYESFRDSELICKVEMMSQKLFFQKYLLKFFELKARNETSKRLLVNGEEAFSDVQVLSRIVRFYDCNDTFFRRILDNLRDQVKNTGFEPGEMYFLFSHCIEHRDMETLEWFLKHFPQYTTLSNLSRGERKEDLSDALYVLLGLGFSYEDLAKEWTELGYKSKEEALKDFKRMIHRLLHPCAIKPDMEWKVFFPRNVPVLLNGGLTYEDVITVWEKSGYQSQEEASIDVELIQSLFISPPTFSNEL